MASDAYFRVYNKWLVSYGVGFIWIWLRRVILSAACWNIRNLLMHSEKPAQPSWAQQPCVCPVQLAKCSQRENVAWLTGRRVNWYLLDLCSKTVVTLVMFSDWKRCLGLSVWLLKTVWERGLLPRFCHVILFIVFGQIMFACTLTLTFWGGDKKLELVG